MNESELSTGQSFVISQAPFKERDGLVMAVLSELKGVKLDGDKELDPNLIKDMVCTFYSSHRIRAAADKILARCTIDGDRVTLQTKDEEWYDSVKLEIFVKIILTTMTPFLSKAPVVFEEVLDTLGLKASEIEEIQT